MNKAFTLIELLIVVAIIAILAAIAVPNFLEAQTRSKVSRAKADIRSLATGLEAYAVDANAYPQCNSVDNCIWHTPNPAYCTIFERLSTPIAYMTSGILQDPFRSQFRSGAIDSQTGTFTPASTVSDADEVFYKYAAIAQPNAPGPSALALVTTADAAKSVWVTYSVGPDTIKTGLTGTMAPGATGLLNPNATVAAAMNNIYDTTNGTVSTGDVFRVGGANPGLGTIGGAFVTAVQSTGGR